MNFKTIFYSASLVLLTCCNQREETLNPNPNTYPNFRTTEFGFDKNLNMVTFKEKGDVQVFIDNYESSSNKIEGFYERGFVPFRVKDNVDEKTFNALTLKRQEILQKIEANSKNKSISNGAIASTTNNTNASIQDNETFISDDRFASILNAQGEVLVNKKIYRYTNEGLYIVDEEDREYLNNYLANNRPTGAPLPVGFGRLDERIDTYVPPKGQFSGFKVRDPEKDNAGFRESGFGNGGRGGRGGTSVNPWDYAPEDTSGYQNCVPDRPFIDNIFGRNYACEYYFSSDRKLRSIFAAEDYYLFFDVFAQAKFKQKTWLGWFSSRDANSVYVKINDAKMTLGDRKIQLKINTDDVKNAISEIEKILDGSSQKKMAYLSNVYTDKGNGTATLEAYSPSFNEISNAANKTESMITPQKKSLVSDIRVNFEDLFGKTPKKVFVVTLLGKEQAITDYDIVNITAKAYKDYVTKANTPDNKQLPAGVVILKKAMNGTSPNEEGEVVSYSFANDIVKVNGLAVASRPFNIPKQFKLENATIEFDDWKWLPKRINIEMSWKKPQKYDVDIEAGAYYGGKWGGSKFRVVKE
ncbi:hypothetical protein CMT45_10830 [Elizabethkingia anophelis]|nr:hypothetical protein [Elizabethkingia anophelis]MCT3959777.1 hypothetical protein [Elizabethkingia anophelis]MDV4072204.1 hypothetical protein [Elizabethkingia anophelis]